MWLKQDDEYFWYLNDQLGTPQKLVDSTGNVVWSAQYAAFGKATIQIETIENHLRFPGEYYDQETGLHYNNQRYYDPEHGRYTQTDPIGFNGGDVNLYAYVRDNPVTLFDPMGLWSLPFPANSRACNYSSDMCLIVFDADHDTHSVLYPGQCSSFWSDEGDFAYWNGYWFKMKWWYRPGGGGFIDDRPIDTYPQSPGYIPPFNPKTDTTDGFKPNSPPKEDCYAYCRFNQASSHANDLKDMTGGVDACVYACKHPAYPGDK